MLRNPRPRGFQPPTPRPTQTVVGRAHHESAAVAGWRPTGAFFTLQDRMNL